MENQHLEKKKLVLCIAHPLLLKFLKGINRLQHRLKIAYFVSLPLGIVTSMLSSRERARSLSDPW